MIVTHATLSTAGMHVAELKTTTENKIASSKNNTTKGVMITMNPSMTNLTDDAPQKEGTTKEELKPFPVTRRGCASP
jgi:hypothetical protein